MEYFTKYKLRPLREEDLPMVLAWRNSPKVHRQMLTDHLITWEEHHAWFQRIKEQPLKRNFIFEYLGVPIGYIGYTEFDIENHTCSPGAYLGVGVTAPQEAALCMFYVSIEYAFENLQMVRLNTDVFADNKRALKLDALLGYEISADGDHYISKDGEEKLVHRLVMDRDKWLDYKKELAGYISIQ